MTIALIGMSAIAFAGATTFGVIFACVNNSSGTIHIVSADASCANNEVLLVWNQQGPEGAQGPIGPQGPAGPSDAFSTEAGGAGISVPTTFTTILSRDVPAGKYVVIANVTVHNFSNPRTTLPVNCALGSPSEFSVPYSVRIDPFDSATAQGASTATIPLTLTTELSSPGTLTLQCQTNTGPGGQTALATSRQITAIKVGSLTELDLAP